ncbi:hypothetical protein LCGC14_1662100 [marine sediment metagenome]|uniref:Uncharacterized protein n=1 Tax=marine sediment metagenome TaxID=412755 RepID=A0A0F9HUF2_9ZZZZ
MTPLACTLSGIALLCCTLAYIIIADLQYRRYERRTITFDMEEAVLRAAALGKLSELREALEAEDSLREVRE